MNIFISIIDRLILESLNKKPKTSLELQGCTSLELKIIETSLKNLSITGFITHIDGRYTLNNNLNPEQLDSLKNHLNMTNEINEIINASLSKSSELNNFKLKKVYLTETEEKILNGMLYNLESFFNNLTVSNQPTHKQKIIYWGNTSYENLIYNYLNS